LIGASAWTPVIINEVCRTFFLGLYRYQDSAWNRPWLLPYSFPARHSPHHSVNSSPLIRSSLSAVAVYLDSQIQGNAAHDNLLADVESKVYRMSHCTYTGCLYNFPPSGNLGTAKSLLTRQASYSNILQGEGRGGFTYCIKITSTNISHYHLLPNIVWGLCIERFIYCYAGGAANVVIF
jgi:hypothetical protein